MSSKVFRYPNPDFPDVIAFQSSVSPVACACLGSLIIQKKDALALLLFEHLENLRAQSYETVKLHKFKRMYHYEFGLLGLLGGQMSVHYTNCTSTRPCKGYIHHHTLWVDGVNRDKRVFAVWLYKTRRQVCYFKVRPNGRVIRDFPRRLNDAVTANRKNPPVPQWWPLGD